MAREKREKATKTKRAYVLLPVTSKVKLEMVYEKLKSRVSEDETHPSRTDILETFIKEKYKQTFNPVAKNQIKMGDFIDQYILEHFGEDPEDFEYTQSEALKAYYKTQGFELDTSDTADDDSFICSFKD